MSISNLPIPDSDSILFEDSRLYVCLAQYPITKGHIVVVWKADAPDLHYLAPNEYAYLMSVVRKFREKQIAQLGVEKVYLVYMDEAKQVHWHLVPRYNEQGYNMFSHNQIRATEYSLRHLFI